MGHLINPIAFRLGHTRSWEDSWFVKGVYYPEFFTFYIKNKTIYILFLDNNFYGKKWFFIKSFLYI